MKSYKDRFISLFLSIVMIFSLLPLEYVKAETAVSVIATKVTDQQTFDVFRYGLFSGSKDTALTFNGSQMKVVGDVHSNSSFVGHYSRLDITGNLEAVKSITANGSKTTIGKKITNSNVIYMPDFYQKLTERYKETAKVYYTSTSFNSPTLNVDVPMIVHGDITFNNSEVSGKGFILADKDIRFNVSKLKANTDSKVVYYSANGNITINASNTQINGILYAPNGTVTFHGSNLIVNGRIVANKIVLDGSSININTSPDDLQIINQAPIVEAGEPQEIELESDVALQGRVEDEGLINKDVTTKWEKVSGPGNVTFSTANTAISKAKFDQAGEYVLKLSAYDGQYTSSDSVKITVKEITKPNLILNISGRKVQNRKITLDVSSSTSNPKYQLIPEKTEWSIVPVTAGLSQEDIKIDVDSTSPFIKNLVFKKTGDYKVSVKIVNQKESDFKEQIITILADEKPVADFKVNPSFLRDPSNNNMALIPLKDMSYSPDNDKIAKRVWKIRYDSNNNGIFDDETYKIIDDNNNTEAVYFTSEVGRYSVDLEVVEGFDDTIAKFLTEDDYQKGNTSTKTAETRIFVVDNVKPETHIEMQKAKNADIVFTVGRADFTKINDFSNRIEAFKKVLLDKGINANVTTVSTSSITASDSFAWDTYDHYNFRQSYGPTLPNHITVSGKDIKMIGYTEVPYKDFLFVADDNKTQKTFSFDMQRDATDWHSMEGGGFLFNSSIKDGKIQGFCVLVTQQGIKLDKITNVNVNDFRNGKYEYVQYAGSLLKNYPINNAYNNHNFKIVVDPNTVSLWDNGVLIIDNFALPANDYGSGFGPITSHASHGCGQQSYFTFKNIVMQTVNGKSLAEVLNEQKWRSDAEKFVVNLSDDQVQDLKTSDMISKVSEIILQKGLYFGGLGTATNESQYKALINGIAGNGIYLNSTDFNLAMNNLENFMLSKILSKNYLINNYVNQGESVSYIDSYKDIENDPIMETKWKYVHDPNVFENNSGLIDSNDTYIDKPITIFDKIGAYGITLKARDNPFGVTDYLDAFRKWSDETELSKAIVVQRRPIAKLDVKLTLSADKTTCFATMEEDCYDLDHENTADKGIVSKEYKWKKVSDEGWTEGRLPSKLPVGQDYLAMMVVTDKEGTCSDSAVKLISTKALIQPTPVADTTKPTLTLALSKTEANIGDVVQVYVDAKDNVGIDKIEIYVDGKLASVALGARINFVANEVKTIPVEARVVDPSGNEARATAECKVVDNRDKVPPVVQITTPKPDSLIITPTQLIGTATDDIQLASYKLQYRLKGALDYITFAQATEGKSNGILGVFDPTTLANGDYEVRLTAEDVIGNSAYIENTYVVDRTKIPGADTEKPSIEITLSKTTANIGEEVQATVKATDNVKVDKLVVYVDGKLVMQDQGTVTFTSSSAKIMKVEVSAIDSSGNEARQINECQFIGTSDKIAPVVNIALPAANTAITKATEITGTAKDETQLERYRLQYRLKGAADYITFLESTTAKTDEVLGVFDPTLLKAGTYEVKLIAEDKGGNSAYIETTFVVPAPDTEKPLVSLVLSKATANVGDTVEATIKVTDNVKVSKVSVYLDGKLVMENQGTLTFTASEAKIMKLQVVASDTSGNEATQTAECSVIDTRDKIAPVVNITLPVIGRAITKPTAITGTAMDETKLERYRLQYRLQGTTDFTTFAEAQEPIIDGTLGTFDPTNLKNGIYEIRLIAEDKGGNNSYIQNIYLVEAAVNDTEKPTINLVVSKSVANLNDVVQVYTVAKDNVAVDKLELFIDGKLTELKGGIASFTASEVKTVSIKAVAVDTNGNQSEQTVECRVLDNRDAVPPTAEIKTPEADTHILAPTKIIGTAKDETKLYSYKLEYRLKDSKDFTLFKQSTDSKSNEELGVFDPTMLVNGIYEVRLSVEDMGGNILRTTTTYVVEGEMKIGHMSMGFEDINTSVSGMKMSVTRQYDNGNKQKGDFGIGWTLGLHNMKIYVSTPLGEGWEQVQQGTNLSTRYIIRETIPHYITVTYGDGKSDTFKASLSTQYQQYVPISQTKMNFQCTTNPRVKLELTGDNTVDILGGIGSIQLFSSDSLFDDYILNPQRFKLTNEEGTEVTIHVTNGIESIKDKNGNTMIIGKDGIKDSSGNGVIFTRDSQNRIITAKDPAGNITTYGYDAAEDLVSVKNPLGDVVGFKYDSKHNIIQITDPRGIAVARNEYDENGRLVATIDAAGNRMEYSHDVAGRQEVIKDRLGNTTVINYDEKGNVLSKTDALGNDTRYTYDARNNKLTELDSAGKITTYTYDEWDNVTSVTNEAGNKTESTYDNQGRLLTETDPMGNVSSQKYNAAGNISEEKDKNGNTTIYTYDGRGNTLTTTNAKGGLTKYTYDSSGNRLTETAPDGGTTTYTYDENGNQKTRTVIVEGKTLTTTFTYDSLNRLTKTTNPDGTESTVVYNAIGKKSVVTDTAGKNTQIEYDILGNLSKITYIDKSVENFTYDSEGRKLTSTDRMGRTTGFTYDKAGRQIKTTFADGTRTETVYNVVGEEVKKIDENGNATEYTYDTAGRNTVVKDALGNITTYEYDKNSNKVKMTDAKGNVTSYIYDANNMLTTITFANGSTIIYAYDVLGNKVSETDQQGKTTQFAYDLNTRPKKVTDVLGNGTEYSYDEFGSMAIQKDANGHETQFDYDVMGRRVKRTLQAGMSETFAYERVGDVTSHTSFKGDTTTFVYDDLARVIQRKYADGSLEKFAYYADGQKKSVEDKRGITSYQYDAKGRLTKQTNPDGTELSYTYDSIGNRTSVTIPSGTTAYTYDALNRLTKVTDSENKVTKYTYDVVGNRESITYPNGNIGINTYDNLNRLIKLENKRSDGTIINSYEYTLGAAGNRTKVVENTGRTEEYTYDETYKLTGEKITNGSLITQIAYTYDAVGNRLTKNDNGTVTTYTYDANDRLLTENVKSYTYDANGNTLSVIGEGQNISYSYDYNNRLIGLKDGKDSTVYEYDTNGIRISKSVNGQKTNYLVDSNRKYSQVLEERDANGTLIVSYVYGDDLISQTRGGVASYYIYDGHGSTRALTDSVGKVTDTYTYDAFGVMIDRTGNTLNDYLYTAEQYDANSGFYYLRARYMNPNTGRFVSMDSYEGSIFEPVSIHKYLYANANPIMYLDPSGYYSTLAECNISFSIMSILGNFVSSPVGLAALKTATVVVGAIVVKQIITDVEGRILGGIPSDYLGKALEALEQLEAEFEKFKSSKEFKRQGNHWVEIMEFSGLQKTPENVLWSRQIGTVNVKYLDGGKPGRIFQFKYGIGKNATLGAGLFLFRADYMSYETKPATFSPHYHLRYGNINIDHETF